MTRGELPMGDRTYRAFKGYVGLYGELCQEYVVRSLHDNRYDLESP